MNGIGEDAGGLSSSMTTHMVKALTPSGILAGLGTIAGASLNMSNSVVSAVPVLSSLAGYGLVKGLKAVLEANGLNCIEKEGVWEITAKNEQSTVSKQEGTDMDERKQVQRQFRPWRSLQGIGEI